MRVNFFEEYPTEENLEKSKMIDFSSTVFLAGHSLAEFEDSKKKLLAVNPNLETAYWPVIPRTYWISPFSYTSDLKNFVAEMATNKNPLRILIDLELPLLGKWFLYFRPFSFLKNKKIIKQFLKDAKNYNLNIVTAEYASPSMLMLKIYRMLGISYDPKIYGHKACVMYYTSMIGRRYDIGKVKNTLLNMKRESGGNLELGLGTIATGVFENEPILTPEKLAEDLEFMKENGFDTATIFRLGGFNEDYYKAVKKYAN